jgi:radical SAM superfamily enzyme YgiQ (UPF0313 family)
MTIEYEMPLYRPPSEAYSLILQATIGCTHNRCAFCVAYQNKKFRVRPEEDVFDEIDWAAEEMPDTRRVFLADGDAFALSPDKMVRILERLYEKLPDLERVTAYASPQNFKNRSVDDIRPVREAGLTMLYFGLESGDDEVLKRIDKGATCDEMVSACQKAQEAGFDLSVTVILGLAGPQGSKRHAELTAKALDRISPRFAAALTLMLAPRKPAYPEVYNHPDWRVLDPNHASNYLALKGDLQKDKQKLLGIIDAALNDPDSPLLRPEFMRAL